MTSHILGVAFTGTGAADIAAPSFLAVAAVSLVSLGFALFKRKHSLGGWHSWLAFLLSGAFGFVALFEYYSVMRSHDPLRDVRFASFLLIPTMIAALSLSLVRRKTPNQALQPTAPSGRG